MDNDKLRDLAENEAWDKHKFEADDIYEADPFAMFNEGYEAAISHSKERIAELEKDAERYRWLKEQNADLDHDTFVVLAHDSTAEEQWQKYWVGSDLDKSIDEAMKESE